MDKELTIIIDEWLAAGQIAGQSSRTHTNKRNLYKRFLAWLSDRTVTPELAQAYILHLQTKDYARSSIRTEISNLIALDNFSKKQGYRLSGWSRLLKRPKALKRADFEYVAPETVDEIIFAGTEVRPYVRRGVSGDNARNKYIKEETRAALMFVNRTGLRIQEVLKLKGSDLNLFDTPPSFRIAPSKGHGDEFAWIPQDMIEEMKKRAKRARVFEARQETCNLALRRGCKVLGIESKVSNHILRHIFATTLLKNKVPMYMIQKAMRHNNINQTVDQYGHLDRDDVFYNVSIAHPLIRKAMSFEDKVAIVEQTIKNLHLDQDQNLQAQMTSGSSQFTFTMKKSH